MGLLVSIIYASLNLMLPQIIKEFMRVMTVKNKETLQSALSITQTYVLLQLARMIFGNHMKRLFVELALKVESTLSMKLVKKALSMDDSCRMRIPESEVYQL